MDNQCRCMSMTYSPFLEINYTENETANMLWTETRGSDFCLLINSFCAMNVIKLADRGQAG